MKLRYIGENNLYGLVKDKEYDVEIFTKGNYIWLKVESRPAAIPYDTPQALSYNWKSI